MDIGIIIAGDRGVGRIPQPFDRDALASALLGYDLPPGAEQELRLAGLAYEDSDRAEFHLQQARALAPDHPAVLIGFYRYYFYKGRLPEALTIARLCLLHAASDNALDLDWRRVEAEDATFGDYAALLPRFYLFTLKAYAYLQLRLGHLQEGYEAALKTLSLDPSDKVGAGVLLDVLRRATGDCDEE